MDDMILFWILGYILSLLKLSSIVQFLLQAFIGFSKFLTDELGISNLITDGLWIIVAVLSA